MEFILQNRELTETEIKKQEEWKKKNIERAKKNIRDLERLASEIHKAIPAGYNDNTIRREIDNIIKGIEKQIRDGIF